MSKQLTAEQIRKAITNGIQAIADELNAVLDDETHDATDTQNHWHQFFGTPEKTAQTLHHNGTLNCRECLLRDECAKTPEDSDCMIAFQDVLLEWLNGDA